MTNDVDAGAPDEHVEDKVEPATLDDLLAKPAATDSVLVQTPSGLRSLKLRAMGGEKYDDLEAAHPPEDDDVNAIGVPLNWNPRTFPPALVAACLVDPVLSEAEVRQIFESPTWSKAELDRLFDSAYVLNRETAGVTRHLKG